MTPSPVIPPRSLTAPWIWAPAPWCPSSNLNVFFIPHLHSLLSPTPWFCPDSSPSLECFTFLSASFFRLPIKIWDLFNAIFLTFPVGINSFFLYAPLFSWTSVTVITLFSFVIDLLTCWCASFILDMCTTLRAVLCTVGKRLGCSEEQISALVSCPSSSRCLIVVLFCMRVWRWAIDWALYSVYSSFGSAEWNCLIPCPQASLQNLCW